MIKQVFLNGRFLTRPLSGVQRTAFEITQALDKQINQNQDILKRYSFSLIYSGRIINDIDLKHIKFVNKGIFKGLIWEQFELPFYTAGKLLISMCSISSIFKRKQLVIIHDASALVNPQFFSKTFVAWYKFAIPLLGKISEGIITVSNFSKNELVRFARIKPEKITVIYNASDHILEYNEPDNKFKSFIDSHKPFCLAVSNLGANKNFKGLSIALSNIDFSKFKMLVAGGVTSGLNNVNKEKNITYLGYVTDSQLKYLYQNAALFIFPSFYEGFGIPPLEAMVLGCPVIASRTSAIPEVLNDACEYLDPFNPLDMSVKIDNLLKNDEKLAKLRSLGYLQAGKYNWIKSSQQLLNLIEKTSD